MKDFLFIYGILFAVVCSLAIAAGICYEIGSFWTWQALRYIWGV